MMTVYAFVPFLLVLLICVVMAYRYSEHNRAQKVYIGIVLTWIVIIGARIAQIATSDIIPTHSTISLPFIMLAAGIFCFWLTFSFPIIVLNPKLLFSRPALLSLSPMILSVVAYIVYHLYAGLPLNEFYTPSELWANRGHITIIMRFVIVGCFILGLVFSLISAHKLIESYQTYVDNNFSNTEYNVGWLRKFNFEITAVSTAYFVWLFYVSDFTAILYVIVTGSAFVSIMDSVIMHRVFELPKGYSVEWSLKRGWYWCGEPQEPHKEIAASLEAKFYDWIKREKPYCDKDFAATGVTAQFPSLSNLQLKELLAKRGQNFQSFVRECRIKEAERIMKIENGATNWKSIAFLVGFSHYSSFCRAFVAVNGHAPSDLDNKIKR